MVTKQMVQGTWNEVVGRLRAKWGQLNQNDLEQFKGNTEALAGYIQRHTGEAPKRSCDFSTICSPTAATRRAMPRTPFAIMPREPPRLPGTRSMRPRSKRTTAMPTRSTSFKNGRQPRLARHLPRERSSGSALRCWCGKAEPHFAPIKRRRIQIRSLCRCRLELLPFLKKECMPWQLSRRSKTCLSTSLRTSTAPSSN